MKSFIEIIKRHSIPIVVLLISFLGTFLLPVEEIYGGLIAFPGVSALFLVLYQSFRDKWQHEKELDLQNKQRNFILSTSSHIANVVYDKHVLFCEEYVKRIQDGRQELLRDGASSNAINIGTELVRIRHKHSAWLTEDIENKLEPFEQTLIKIGSSDDYLRRTAEQGMNDKKREIIDKLYRSFGLVLGHEKALNDQEANVHIDKIINKIRDILGIKIMTELRSEAINVAIKKLSNS